MTHDMIVVDKSTVPVGTADKVLSVINNELIKRNLNLSCKVVSNPEFLKEGSAIQDCMSPDRVVIGTDDEAVVEVMKELYGSFVRINDRFIVMDIKSAEMTKYASNAMLAARISFMNEIANICESVGADVNKVRLGVGSDSRIGNKFLFPGCGYGGSCFPKDVRALIKTASDNECEAGFLKQIEEVNFKQKYILINKVISVFGEDLSNKVFAIWGLAFKPNTDDMREAPSIIAIKELMKRGAHVQVYDPKAMEEAKHVFKMENINEVVYCSNKYDALNDVNAMLLLTEWKEFRSPDFDEMKLRMKQPLIFDGRNQYSARMLVRESFSYWQIGVKEVHQSIHTEA
jgi:UDPglucose 6-dehydrogenase